MKDLIITDVEQQLFENKVTAVIHIRFNCNGQRMLVSLGKTDEGDWLAKYVSHIDHNSEEPCLFCQKHIGYLILCSALQEELQALVERLVEFPSIRLYWVFNQLRFS